jgi:serine/threonine-protein kinase
MDQPEKSPDEQETFFLASELQTAADPDSAKIAEPMSGRRIGPYRVVQLLGHGGMGAVYLAARADEQYEKQVAIKLVKPGMDDSEILTRFHNERQILATMDHPNIAKLLDGGTTDDGAPYLVMDFVDGEPLDEYCDWKKLSIVARLQLFQQICSAVQYAHQRLVIHRDIKPNNILVTVEGVPKLLDFGIAKLIQRKLVTDPSAVTETILHPMTPDYASPEQVRGEPITTASDVYSLGVVLYRILTGHHPYRFRQKLPHEIARVITEQEPVRPSTVVLKDVEQDSQSGMKKKITREEISALRQETVSRLNKRLKGDLDNILLMALRKDPQRRYSSVEQFSEDIRRHLEGLPVIARKDTIGYRSVKFIQRNKVLVASAVLLFITLVAGVVATTWQARVARAERDKARAEAEKAEQINSFLQAMLNSTDPEAEGDKTVQQILDETAKRIDTDLAGQAPVQASVRNTIGKSYMALGLYDQAEKQFRSALQTEKRLYGSVSSEVSVTLLNLGLVLHSKGDIAAAEPLYRQALATVRQSQPKHTLEETEIMNHLAQLFLSKGQLDEAEKMHRDELAIRRSLLGKDNLDIAQSLNDLAVVLGTKGDYSSAERLHREALSILRKSKKGDDAYIAVTMSNLASIVVDSRKDYPEAEQLYQQALAMRERLYGHEHPLVAWTLYNYAFTLYQKGDYARAADLAQKALKMRGKTLNDEHPVVAGSLQVLGRSLLALNHADQAEPLLRESLDLRKKNMPPDHWLVATSESVLGECLLQEGKYSEAEKLLVPSYEKLKQQLGENHDRTKEAAERVKRLNERGRSRPH